MNRRNFAAGVVHGAILMGVAFFADTIAVQNGGMTSLPESEKAHAGENLAFFTPGQGDGRVVQRARLRKTGVSAYWRT